MRWILLSVGLSVALTIALNLVLRVFPGASRRVERTLFERVSPDGGDRHRDGRRVRFFVPWKAMIVVSVMLTIVLNVFLWIV